MRSIETKKSSKNIERKEKPVPQGNLKLTGRPFYLLSKQSDARQETGERG